MPKRYTLLLALHHCRWTRHSYLSCMCWVPSFAAHLPACLPALLPCAGLLDGRRLPLTSYYITNGLLLFIYSLQLFWFHRIVKIFLGHENHEGEPAATAEVKAVGAAGAAGLAPAGDKKRE